MKTILVTHEKITNFQMFQQNKQKLNFVATRA